MARRRPCPWHRWPADAAEAAALQRELAGRVVRRTAVDTAAIETVAGVDAAYTGGRVRAAVAVLALATLEPLEQAFAERPAGFPYVPGLLGFREAPAVLAALEGLSRPPDLLLVDGHGIAHPRRLGLASHLGLLAGIPSVGCAKSRLVGRFEPPAAQAGSCSLLTDRGETVGAVVRTRTGVRPVFVSTGHRVGLDEAVRLVLACCRGFRLPEPLRRADRLSRQR